MVPKTPQHQQPQQVVRSLPNPCKMPRDGPSDGGGVLTVKDRNIYEGQVKEAMDSMDEMLSVSLRLEDRRSRQGRRPSAMSGSNWSPSSAGDHRVGGRRGGEVRSGVRTPLSTGFETESPRSSVGCGGKDGVTSNKRLGPQERKRQEMYFKWQKTEALRQRDRKAIQERIEKGKEMRHNRYIRLRDSVAGEGKLASETAKCLRDRAEYEEQRRTELHAEWQRNVHWPLHDQVDRRLNPPNRAREQTMSGTKSVAWNLPEDEFKLGVRPHEDPNRRPLYDAVRENTFHQTAEMFLGRSSSAPQMHTKDSCAAGPSGVQSMIPRARSKETLDPTSWNQGSLQGTLYGFWAQTCEHGVGFRKCIRGGPDIHVPDESDGALAAGTRVSRTHGHHDKGILSGDRASRGEAAQHKMGHGTSCAAPAQDHYTFERGAHVKDLEFARGKRAPPVGSRR